MLLFEAHWTLFRFSTSQFPLEERKLENSPEQLSCSVPAAHCTLPLFIFT